MTIVAFVGDWVTTTTLATAANWPRAEAAVVIEADRSGGDLAAWLDIPVMPSLSTIVTTIGDGGWDDVQHLVRTTPSGVQLVPAPVRAVEAHQAVTQSARALVPALAANRSAVALVDAGALDAPTANPFVMGASITVVVHRQAEQSARAAAARLQRLADQVQLVSAASTPIIVALVGQRPFPPGEVHGFLVGAGCEVEVAEIPLDTLSAAVFGGRTGVPHRRLRRLPLNRGARELAEAIDRVLGLASRVDAEVGR